MIYFSAPTKEEFESYGHEDIVYASRINKKDDCVILHNAFGDTINTFRNFEVAEVRAKQHNMTLVWVH